MAGVQSAYWGMLEEGRINQTAANLLMQSVDEAMDLVSNEALCDWRGLKRSVHLPSYYKYLHISRIPQRLVTYFTVQRLESACYICAAFLRAHRIARRQLHEFIGRYPKHLGMFTGYFCAVFSCLLYNDFIPFYTPCIRISVSPQTHSK